MKNADIVFNMLFVLNNFMKKRSVTFVVRYASGNNDNDD